MEGITEEDDQASKLVINDHTHNRYHFEYDQVNSLMTDRLLQAEQETSSARGKTALKSSFCTWATLITLTTL